MLRITTEITRFGSTLRLEGRDYVMADGEVITIKFTP